MNSQMENYFCTINSMASRICEDMKQAKSAYEDLWDNLSTKEQEEILNEAIITPEIQMMYDKGQINKKTEEFATKMVMDENCSYRDEHSAPFSFKTRSQRDLTVFSSPVKKTEKRIKPVLKNKKPMETSILSNNESKIINENNDASAANTLPKTGLDFLDNW